MKQWIRTFVLLIISHCTESLLYPRESETRDVFSLNGIWNFVVAPASDPLLGFKQKWYSNDFHKIVQGSEISLMPVPSSYNDITQNASVRDHIGLVWYEKKFFLPKLWNLKERILVRFSSVSYAAKVWINGNVVASHEIGHLPFEAVINPYLKFGAANRITVACDNILLNDTIPQGSLQPLETDEGTILIQSYTFDFSNYAGIDRPVTLYTTPWIYVNDITIGTTVKDTTGVIFYNVSYRNAENVTCTVILNDKNDIEVLRSETSEGILEIPNAKLWWPHLMHTEPGYLYSLQVELRTHGGTLFDVYRQPIGIREISWSNNGLFINNRRVYLQGFGRHEDADIRGKGLDLPTVIKDHNLIKWVGANCYRTSHYPYADEIMDVADELGIMIIDECPSVNTDLFSEALLKNHKASLSELIQRDKNRPSVIMWSVANEARTQNPNASEYFSQVVAHVKSLDKSRPVTMAINVNYTKDVASQHLDIISFNHYYSWYYDTGYLDAITNNVIKEAYARYMLHNKSVLMSEYGADTIAGLHISPPFVWSEEYQLAMMSKHFKAFDYLRTQPWFVGEFIWNFADFQTAQRSNRAGGNKKGIFMRNRQPKASAYHLRRRYFNVANELYNSSIPDDIVDYVSQKVVPKPLVF